MPARKKSTTVTRKKATTRRKRKAPSTAFGSRRYKVSVTKGALVGVGPDGQEFFPVACGPHRSVPVFERSNDDKDAKPDGFDPSCEECVAQAESTAAYADTHHTV